MLRVEITRRSVFLSRQKPAYQPLPSALGGAFGEMSEQRSFNRSSNNTAAQQARVHLTLLAFLVRDRDSNQPVVAETIAYPAGKYVPLCLFRHLRDLRLGV